ncbi:MAG TPA: site-2 protease family protein [Candidatus Paceibacterota bacterium]
MDTVFQIIVLVMSVVVHEVSHGYAARALGDRTAEYAGRLTLNPIRHIDLWGSIIIPAILIFSHAGFVIGWAKPVPVNPHNLRNQRWGEALVSAAGPASNILLALIFGLALRFNLVPLSALPLVMAIVIINLVLAVFNLVPIPPLDGSKILFSVLPPRFWHIREALERYGLVLAIIFILFLWQFVSPAVEWLFRFIVG